MYRDIESEINSLKTGTIGDCQRNRLQFVYDINTHAKDEHVAIQIR